MCINDYEQILLHLNQDYVGIFKIYFKPILIFCQYTQRIFQWDELDGRDSSG